MNPTFAEWVNHDPTKNIIFQIAEVMIVGSLVALGLLLVVMAMLRLMK